MFSHIYSFCIKSLTIIIIILEVGIQSNTLFEIYFMPSNNDDFVKSRITIITGQIRTGKTTYLRKLISSLDDVGGIIQIAEDKKRFFIDISSNNMIELTSQSVDKDTFNIGNFIFRKSAFTWAKEKLEQSLEKGNTTIAIDEFGLLEFHGEGLEPLFSKIINQMKSNIELQLLVVIRETLLKDFLRKFNLHENEFKIEMITK